MLFRTEFLEGIRKGEITLAFRRWRRPFVKAGGTLLTPIGKLSIQSADQVAPEHISLTEAKRAGYKSRELLQQELRARTDGEVYRVELGPLRPDPRISLHMAAVVTEAEIQDRRIRLSRFDARAPKGAWTYRTLEALKAHPGIRSGVICDLVDQEKETFKINVRKLKNLGVTESLGTGYRLAPRCEALLRILSSEARGDTNEH